MSESFIKTNATGGTTFVGRDAVALFRARSIASGLRLYAKTRLKPNRAWTPSAMLKAATGITQKPYRRGEYLKAADDIALWADAMAAGLPVIQQED